MRPRSQKLRMGRSLRFGPEEIEAWVVNLAGQSKGESQ